MRSACSSNQASTSAAAVARAFRFAISTSEVGAGGAASGPRHGAQSWYGPRGERIVTRTLTARLQLEHCAAVTTRLRSESAA
jgi:hypothetical protein